MAIPDRSRIKEALAEFIAENGGHNLEVTPRQAYRGLAARFSLTADDLKKERNWDNLWQNEVRWARQELVAEGILVPKNVSGHGFWQLNPAWQSIPKSLSTVQALPAKTELELIAEDLVSEGVFDPANLSDARDVILRAIVQRRGQQNFRSALLEAYGASCAMTGDNCSPVLEAAHIIPYLGDRSNHTQNGLLLRSDIHTLFDLHLVSVDEFYKIHISPSLSSTNYFKMDGQDLYLPVNREHYPSKEALARHESECEF